MAVMAFIVAAMYGVIAARVVPRLARAGIGGSGVLQVARWGASAFFVGCAVTHLGIGIEAVLAIGDHPIGMSGRHDMQPTAPPVILIQHVVPHIAQIIGGGLFIVIASSRLEWTVVSKEVAEGLREREMQFRSAFERAPAGIVMVSVLDPDPGAVLQINPALRAMVGDLDQDTGRTSYPDLFIPAERATATGDLDLLLAGQAISDREHRLLHRDGHLIWSRVEASMVRDEHGAPLFALAQVRDITGQRRSDTLRAAQHAVAHVVAEAVTVSAGMADVLRELCSLLGWAGGEYWQTDPEHDVIVRLTSWWSPELAGSPLGQPGELSFAKGEGLAGAVWSNGTRIWIGDLDGEPGPFTRAAAARAAGLECAIGLPIESGDQPGVLVILAAQPAEPDHELSSTLDAICAYLAQFVERRRAEEFRRLVESAPDAVLITDLDGRIVRVNARTEQLFGYPREELLGETAEMLLPEQFRSVYPQPRADCYQATGTRFTGTGIELSARRRDGSQFPIEISLSPLETDGQTLISSSIRDITERRQAEQLRFQLAAIVDSSDDAIIGSSLDGTITSWNRGAEEIFGYPEAAALGAPLSMLLPPGHENELEERLSELRKGRRVEHHDSLRLRSDGSEVHVSISMSAIRDTRGSLIGASKVARDITERKRAETELAAAKVAAETASQDFEAFSYSVAHDLRAPLRAIDAFSQILESEYAPVLDEAGRGYLARVRASAQRMGALIESMLKLARVTHQELGATRVDLSALARSVTERLRQDCPGRRVEVAIEPGLSALGDASLLANALDNLLTNAWKFTRDRPDARIEFGLDEAGYFVRDNGAGFDMTFSPKLFGVFQRLHTQEEFEGTGIGLATVQRIIRRHGGQIRAEATPGQGATFHFTLARDRP